jgi:hypothetical protein
MAKGFHIEAISVDDPRDVYDYFHDSFLYWKRRGNPGGAGDKSPGYWDRPERAQGAVFQSHNLAGS